MLFPVATLIDITFAFASTLDSGAEALTAVGVALSYLTAAPTVSLAPTLGNKRRGFLHGNSRNSFPLTKNPIQSIDDSVVTYAVQPIDMGRGKAVLKNAGLCCNPQKNPGGYFHDDT